MSYKEGDQVMLSPALRTQVDSDVATAVLTVIRIEPDPTFILVRMADSDQTYRMRDYQVMPAP